MNKQPVSVLLVEDNPGDCRLIVEALAEVATEEFGITTARTLAEALDFMQDGDFDAILLDLSLPDSQGLETVSSVHHLLPSLPIVVLTGLDDAAAGVDALRAGAQEYLVKGQVGPQALARVIRHATERKRLEDALRSARDELEQRVAERTFELAQTVRDLETQVAERARAERQLQSLNETLHQRAAQLRALAIELTRAEQKERRRVAELLHDHLQQLLVAAKMGASALHARFRDTAHDRLIHELSDLLDQAIHASRSLVVELSPAVLYHGGLAAALEWLGEHTLRNHGLKVDVLADPDVEPDSEDTRVLLFQCVRELVFNIVKHAGTDSAQIILQAQDESSLRLTVSDEGVGFDPDQPGDEQGGGFGLFSIRERIDLIGGRMHIDSAPGLGTSISLVTPFRQGETLAGADESQDRGTAPAGVPCRLNGRIRVLLVDDHALVRRGIMGLLEEEPDIEVVGEAEDGYRAIDMARGKLPDVIVMDLQMPGMDGVEATRRIREELPQIRIVGLSMYDEAARADEMRAAGASAYLTKGGSSDALLTAIRRG